MKKLLLLALAAVMCSGCVVLDPNVRYEVPRVTVSVAEVPEVVYEEVVYDSPRSDYYNYVVESNRSYLRERDRRWYYEGRGPGSTGYRSEYRSSRTIRTYRNHR